MSSVLQTTLPGAEKNIPVRLYSARHTADAVRMLTRSMDVPRNFGDPAVIGVSILKNPDGGTDMVAFATSTYIITLPIDSSPSPSTLDASFRQVLEGNAGLHLEGDKLLEVILVGFDMPQIAISLQNAFGARVRGVDLGSLYSPSTFVPWLPGKVVSKRLYSNVDAYEVNELWNGNEQGTTTVCLRAWISAKIGVASAADIGNARKIDTRLLNLDELDCLRNLCLESYLLDRAKPRETPNEFNSFKVHNDGMKIENSRYRTRVRRSELTRVVITSESGKEYFGRASHAKGKTTTIRSTAGSTFSGTVKSVRVVGRQDATNSEKAQQELLLLLLRGEKDLRTSFFTRTLWFPKWKAVRQDFSADCGDIGKDMLSEITLNPSQKRAAEAMTSGTPLVVTHGPPGTGKTTTIAAAAKVWDMLKAPTWIVAHSNVAVKNIAESLYKKNVTFMLIISKEFYEEWHEHLYDGIQSRLIRSDELPKDKVGMERLFKGSSIVLSTLSMLSNPALQDNGTFALVPMERLVIDEASQIRIFEYMHIFIKFQKDLLKVCFFGDPKQLPPFGIEKAPKIQTVFDLNHILSRDTSFFLDTQYRMPTCIGSFISQAVYQSKLKTVHQITTFDCLKFVDVGVHGEETKDGFSWKNPGEVQIIVELVRTYYRYKNFCVLSPYDAQRAAIERQLKAEKLPWESVYNVDSFQGNEADYVLISVVRSIHPGFLVSNNRMNVLLTRCKKGMVIVANRHFISNGGAYTLLGRLSRSVGPASWVSRLEVIDNTASFPGAPSRKAPSIKPAVSLQTNALHERPPAQPRMRTLSQNPTWADVASLESRHWAYTRTTPHQAASPFTVTNQKYYPALPLPGSKTQSQISKYSTYGKKSNPTWHPVYRSSDTPQNSIHSSYSRSHSSYHPGYSSYNSSTYYSSSNIRYSSAQQNYPATQINRRHVPGAPVETETTASGKKRRRNKKSKKKKNTQTPLSGGVCVGGK